ncbi:MAG: extracellular solute-binding protein [Spirochaetaceae bacterium]|nr:extracellular solute-binding protein [Spirochaetaceae bacterium]
MKKFDLAVICTALAVLALAVFFYPVKRINFKRTTLVFSQWLNDDMDRAVLDNIIEEFEKSRPGVNIIAENRTYKNLKNDCAGYLDAIAGGRSGVNENKKNTHRFPDIITVDPLWFDDFEKSILFANQNSGETREGAAKNEVYTRPLYSYFNALFYNISILEDAGFDRPPKTRAEFAEVCLRLKEKNIYGLSVSGNFFTDIFPWIWTETGTRTPQTINGEKDGFDFDEKNFVGSMDFFNSLNRHNTLGRPPFIKDEDEKINNFIAGKTAMITASSKLIEKLETRENMRFGITNIPYPENHSGRPVFSMNCVHTAVLSTSRYKEEAFEFVEFLSAANAALSAASGAISEAVFESSWAEAEPSGGGPDEPPLEEVYAKARSMAESAEGVDEWRLFSACASLGSIASEEINSMFRYRQSAADTAKNIKKRYDSAVSDSLY